MIKRKWKIKGKLDCFANNQINLDKIINEVIRL